jgi:prepilin-type N-terminal cleavage/methylation domain-containing protein
MSLSSLKRGFTLIELLLVIGIIAILAAIVIVAINPTKQLGDARNAQRRSDVNTILNAVYQYSIDNNGNLPMSNTVVTEICRSVPAADCTGLIDLDVLTGAYIVSTGYNIVVANGRVTVAAPGAEQGAVITVTR